MGKVKENVQRQVTISLVVTLLGVQFASESKSLRHLCDRLFDALSKCHNMLGLNLLHMCPFQFPVSVSRISFLSSRKKDGTRNKTIVIV